MEGVRANHDRLTRRRLWHVAGHVGQDAYGHPSVGATLVAHKLAVRIAVTVIEDAPLAEHAFVPLLNILRGCIIDGLGVVKKRRLGALHLLRLIVARGGAGR